MKDTYFTISKHTEAVEYKVNGSRFIAIAYAVKSEQDFKIILNQIKQLHHSASHHCYALILGADEMVCKSSDDREPSNTAGKPILRAIQKKQLTQVAVIVIRYFGGKLLGVSGLIEAYGHAAEMALNAAQVLEVHLMSRFEVAGHYTNQNELFKILKQMHIALNELNYQNDTFSGIFEVRKSKQNDFIHAIENKRMFTIHQI